MPDLSHMSDEELLKIANNPLASVSDEDLMKAATVAPAKTPLEYGAGLVLDPLKKAASTLYAPVEAVSEAIDPYTGAPLRAAVGSAQRGGNLKDVGSSFIQQLGAGKVLPNTPSPNQIVYNESLRAGMPKDLAKTSSDYLGPVAGAVMDLTNFIPSSIPLKGGKLGVTFAKKAAGVASDLADAGAKLGKKGVFKSGQAITLGTLDAGKAMKASENLSGIEMLFPGNMKYGFTKKAGREIGEMRKAFNENPIVLPGARDSLIEVRKNILEAAKNTVSHPQANALADLIEQKVAPKISRTDPSGLGVMQTNEAIEELTIADIDNIIGNLDTLTYTGLGNPKALNRMWGPVVKSSRAELDKVLQTIPEGQLFKEAKSRFEDLSTAGKQRSKLMESIANTGFLLSVTNPSALLTRFLSPSTYIQIVGAAKLPKDAVQGVTSVLKKAYDSKSVENIRDSIAFVAKNHPESAERIVRGIFLASGKPDDVEEKLSGLKLPSNLNQGGIRLPAGSK